MTARHRRPCFNPIVPTGRAHCRHLAQYRPSGPAWRSVRAVPRPDGDGPRHPRLEQMVAQFVGLSPADQDLVLALVRRLATSDAGWEPREQYPADVAFIDFDE